MAFIQIIEFDTERIDEARTAVEEYMAKTQGRRTTRRSLLCSDRDRPGHYVDIVFFDSYESAMENSNLPETSELSQRLGELTTSEPTFLNLEVEWEDS